LGPTDLIPTLIWDLDRKIWYQWTEPGLYQYLPDEHFESEIRIWCELNNIKIKPSTLPMYVRITKTFSEFTRRHTEFNQDTTKLCVMNGIFDLTTRQLMTDPPSLLNTVQLPIKFIPNPQTPHIDELRRLYPTQMTNIERFLQTVLRRDFSIEIEFYLLGGTNSGKGTIEAVIEKGMKGILSHATLADLDDKHGKAILLDKFLNIDTDQDMSFMGHKAQADKKKLVGGDRNQTINEKHVKQYEYFFGCFFGRNRQNP
jgi:phage/plasmid-associated DNA primase